MVMAMHHQRPQAAHVPSVQVVRGDGRPWITPREAEVLVLVASGLSAREIGIELVMASRTVDQHIVNLKMKTGARNRAHMVTIAMCAGLLEPCPTLGSA
jgi:DNA-binding CsgD family transcriptional regulator